MRPSSLRTTAAVLRNIIGLRNDEMAKMCECSIDTIKSVEGGRVALSEALAWRMCRATGVSLKWLLGGDPAVPPNANDGGAFSKQSFSAYVAKSRVPGMPRRDQFSYDFVCLALELRRILDRANKDGAYDLAHYKAAKMLQKLESEFKASEYEKPYADLDAEGVAAVIRTDVDDFLFRAPIILQKDRLTQFLELEKEIIRTAHTAAGYPASEMYNSPSEKAFRDYVKKQEENPDYPYDKPTISRLKSLTREMHAEACRVSRAAEPAVANQQPKTRKGKAPKARA